MVGHHVSRCRRMNIDDEGKKEKEKKQNKNHNNEGNKTMKEFFPMEKKGK